GESKDGVDWADHLEDNEGTWVCGGCGGGEVRYSRARGGDRGLLRKLVFSNRGFELFPSHAADRQRKEEAFDMAARSLERGNLRGHGLVEHPKPFRPRSGVSCWRCVRGDFRSLAGADPSDRVSLAFASCGSTGGIHSACPCSPRLSHA